MIKKVSIIGAGGWGTALSCVLGVKSAQYDICLWAREEETKNNIHLKRENVDYLPGIKLPENMSVTTDLQHAVEDADIVCFVVPSHVMRDVVRQAAPYFKSDAIAVSAAKGLEKNSDKRISQILAEVLPCRDGYVAAISGPNHAEEVAKLIPSATVVASSNIHVARAVQEVFMLPFFRVYTNPDIIGVEIGGALKNIIALAAGASDGLGYGDNTRAALLTRGLAEMARFGGAMGANQLTFAGLSGIGDLMATCGSKHSRNRKVGFEISQGKSVEEVTSSMKMVAEGVNTTSVVYDLAQQIGVDMPIVNACYRVVRQGANMADAVNGLLMRGPKDELDEISMMNF